MVDVPLEPIPRKSDDQPGCPLTFDRFYRDNYRAVVGLVYALSGSRSVAEELAQDAFLAAHRRWGDIARYDNPGAWVRRVAMNGARSRRRRARSELRALVRLRGARQLPVELPDDEGRFWAAMRSLPRRQAQVLALHYYEDRSINEIAQTLACSDGTVRAHLHRGRSALAKRLGTREDLS